MVLKRMVAKPSTSLNHAMFPKSDGVATESEQLKPRASVTHGETSEKLWDSKHAS